MSTKYTAELQDHVLSDWALEEAYDVHLDEVYGTVSIAGLEYPTSQALGDIDPVAYRCGFADWLDSAVSGGAVFELKGAYYSVDPEDYRAEEAEEA
jgi:hypothetical protein